MGAGVTDEQNVYLILTPERARALRELLGTQVNVGDALTGLMPDSLKDTIEGIQAPIRGIKDDLEEAMLRADMDPFEDSDASG